MGILLSIVSGFLPMLIFAWLVYWMDRYEKEPRLLLGGVFIWGALVASAGAFLVNTLLGAGIYLMTGSETATDLTTGSLIAPFVEESLKGFAVLMVYLLFREEFDSVLDGIVYAAVAALGFAATENIYYIYTYGFQEGGLGGLLWMTFVRVVLVGWQHPFYTAFTGIGLAGSRLSSSLSVKLVAPLAGWLLAVFTHSAHNTLASLLQGSSGIFFGTLLDWTGWAFMFLFILWTQRREARWIGEQLSEELGLGLITPAQYQRACSAWAQSGARLEALFKGHYASTDRFYQVCAELAHKKRQLIHVGEESGNSSIVERLRCELSSLSGKISR